MDIFTTSANEGEIELIINGVLRRLIGEAESLRDWPKISFNPQIEQPLIVRVSPNKLIIPYVVCSTRPELDFQMALRRAEKMFCEIRWRDGGVEIHPLSPDSWPSGAETLYRTLLDLMRRYLPIEQQRQSEATETATVQHGPRLIVQVKATLVHYAHTRLSLGQEIAAQRADTSDKTYRRYRDAGWLLSDNEFERQTGKSISAYWIEATGG